MNINLSAPINKLGYGYTGLNILKGLSDLGHNVALFPIGNIDIDQENIPLIQQAINNQSVYDNKAPSIRLWHQFDLAQHIGNGNRIGWPIFELNQFTEREIHHINSQDKLIVCSNWAKNLLESHPSIDKRLLIDVVPLGYDPSIFFPSPIQKGPTIFLNIGKWEIRKGHDILVDMFNSAFDIKDNVELWMLCNNPFLSKEQIEEWHRLYKESPLGDKIKILPRMNSHKDVASVIAKSTCGVFPARAEGFNLDAVEMLGAGRPVILTDYSGHKEFSYLGYQVPPDGMEVSYDGIWFHGQGEWAYLGEEYQEDFIENMVHVYNMHQSGDTIYPRQAWISSFTWSDSCKKLVNILGD